MYHERTSFISGSDEGELAAISVGIKISEPYYFKHIRNCKKKYFLYNLSQCRTKIRWFLFLK